MRSDVPTTALNEPDRQDVPLTSCTSDEEAQEMGSDRRGARR